VYKRILVPTDGSEVSEYAAGAAIDFARVCGAELVALSVAMPAAAVQSAESALVIDAGLEADVLLEHAQQLAAALVERARRAGVACAGLAMLAMRPAQAIIDTAHERHCDLIFMGSHGRRGLSKLVAGSVTQAVLLDAPVPVMVVRPPSAGERVQAFARPCPAGAHA